MRQINKVILCTSDTAEEDIGLAELDIFCRDKGYKRGPDGFCIWHYIIRRNGEIQAGRQEDTLGFHLGRYDKNALLIVLVGSPSNVLENQTSSLSQLLDDLLKEYPDAIVQDASELPIGLKGLSENAII